MLQQQSWHAGPTDMYVCQSVKLLQAMRGGFRVYDFSTSSLYRIPLLGRTCQKQLRKCSILAGSISAEIFATFSTSIPTSAYTSPVVFINGVHMSLSILATLQYVHFPAYQAVGTAGYNERHPSIGIIPILISS